ncbi:MAG: hypothetical protein DWQ44_06585 [Bacteroidetes bacterium]|nr:MAG: hypothetical protein DWQ33_03055 [Bacteroidota bacterium]REK00964.1 MAG: hypothetical protein DWQ39_10350 [Bacteroidota bacterium]REK34567.1 MAG: hypothetical protein DWQ44_06585 [Bacteroidota bacterium]REK51826.1 MAG: hypothetical protein DWQ48_00185 [Bacteroidota bacterium]
MALISIIIFILFILGLLDSILEKIIDYVSKLFPKSNKKPLNYYSGFRNAVRDILDQRNVKYIISANARNEKFYIIPVHTDAAIFEMRVYTDDKAGFYCTVINPVSIPILSRPSVFSLINMLNYHMKNGQFYIDSHSGNIYFSSEIINQENERDVPSMLHGAMEHCLKASEWAFNAFISVAFRNAEPSAIWKEMMLNVNPRLN